MIELQKTSYLDHTIRTEPLHGDAFTDEQGGHKFIITCYQHGEKVNLTGTISGRFMRPGGTVALTGSVSDGNAIITLSSECYQRNGGFLLTVFNTVGSDKFVVYACTGNVRRSKSDPLIDGGEIIDSVEDLISDIQTATAQIPVNYNASFAPAYSTTSPYAVGAYVTNNGNLYRCITAITSGETFDTTHWTQVALATDVSDLKNALVEYSGWRLPLVQFSATRLVTPILSRAEADVILRNFYLADPDNYYLTLYGSNVQNYSVSVELYGWGATLENVRTALDASTYKYHWLFFKNALNGSANISPAEVVYCNQKIESIEEEIISLQDDVETLQDKDQELENDIDNNANYIEPVYLESYSTTRLCTPVFTVATDKNRISQLWLSDDVNYECVLMGNYINPAMDSNGFVILAWGSNYTAFKNALLNTDAVYFYMFFRNKANPNASISPDELSLVPYSATALQKKVASIDDAIKNEYAGKTFAVVCDSIGTHGNSGTWCNVPEITVTADDVGHELSAYCTYYDVYSNINHDTGEGTLTGMTIGGQSLSSGDIGTEITFTPVEADIGKSLGKVFDWNGNDLPVWWAQFAEHYEMIPTPVCWASSSYSTHENDIPRLVASYAWHPSQIRKMGVRTPGTMTRTAPDYVILARGLNDMTHPLNYSATTRDKLTANFFADVNWHFPENDTVDGGYGLKEAISKTIEGIWNAYPLSKIILCTIPYIKRIDYNNFPVTNVESNYTQWNDAIRECADFFGCGLIDFAKDGITHANLATYVPDDVHPNTLGHTMMAKQAIKDWKLI